MKIKKLINKIDVVEASVILRSDKSVLILRRRNLYLYIYLSLKANCENKLMSYFLDLDMNRLSERSMKVTKDPVDDASIRKRLVANT